MPAETLRRFAVVFLQQPTLSDHFLPGQELMEVIAYRLTTLEPHEASPAALLKHLLTSKNFTGNTVYVGFDPVRVIYLINAVDSLLALGINSLELCHLVYEPGGWDPVQRKYPQIEKLVHQLAAKHNQPLENLPKLKIEYIGRRVKDTTKCREIAISELMSALASESGRRLRPTN